MSIKDIVEKIKHPRLPLGDWVFIAIIIMVVCASFGLGRLSAILERKQPIVWTGATIKASLASPISTVSTVGGEESKSEEAGVVTGSRTGSTYHYPWCAGALRIKEENKISFANAAAARAAGYRPAKNCKGLE